jgi:pimeloyl-ACP methyl ester carboxylesterase
MLALRERSAVAGAVATARERWAALTAPGTAATVSALVCGVLAATNGPALLQAARCSDAADSLDIAGAIAAPTLVLCGEADQVNPVAVSRDIAAAIPSARLEVLPGVGHLAKLEAPARVTALLRAHFSE